MSRSLYENHWGSPTLTFLNVLGVLGVLNVLNVLNVLYVLNVLHVLYGRIVGLLGLVNQFLVCQRSKNLCDNTNFKPELIFFKLLVIMCPRKSGHHPLNNASLISPLPQKATAFGRRYGFSLNLSKRSFTPPNHLFEEIPK